MLVLAATSLSGGAAAAARLVAACLTRVAQVNDCSRSPVLVPFLVDNERVGAVPPEVVEVLSSWPAVFECSDPSRVSLSPELAEATLEQRSAAVHEVALALRESGLVTKWRDEPLALVTAFDAPPALLVERRLVPLLGGKGYGVAINGYSRDERGELFLWVATRAEDKATWPAMLDTLAAGAMSAGASVSAAARSEAAEEAGVPDELLAAGLKPVGAVSYRGPDEDPVLPKVRGLTLTPRAALTPCPQPCTWTEAWPWPAPPQDDVFFCFDLELPWDFEPVAVDGEVPRPQLTLTLTLNSPSPSPPHPSPDGCLVAVDGEVPQRLGTRQG